MRRLTLALLAVAAGWAADPDPVELGRKAMAALTANRPKTRQYAFREYHVTHHVDAKGKEGDRETETWDIIGLEGSLYRKLVQRNDKPLSAKEQHKEDQRQEQEAERRRKETPEQRRNRIFSFNYSYSIPFDRLVDVFDLRYLGEKDANGRRTHVLEATTKADFHPTNDNDRETLNYKFQFWLDADDFYPARVDGEIVGEHSRMQKGTTFREDHLRLADGTWVPKANTITYAIKFLKVHTLHGQAVRTYSDYHKFQTDSTIQFTDK